jgi:hypothetical protein
MNLIPPTQRNRWLLPKEMKMYSSDSILKNWKHLLNPRHKRMIIVAPMLMDVVYHDIIAYRNKYQPKQKEKQTINIAFQTTQKYINGIFKTAPDLNEILCDGMDGFDEILSQQKLYLKNVYFSLYGNIKGMTREQIDKTIDLLVMIAFVNSSIGFSSALIDVKWNNDLKVVQRKINDAIDLHWNPDCECEIKQYDIDMLDRCEKVLHKKIIEYIESLEV